MNILDPTKTRAILVGTTNFADFNNIEAVDDNLSEFAKVLADKNIFGLLPKKNIIVIKNETNENVELKLIEHTEHAKEEGINTLIIYFAGHGFRNREGKYFLATKNSRKKLIRMSGNSAIAYDTVKEIIKASQISQTIILIDACYSGSVAQGEGEYAFEEYRLRGTYTLTSSDSTELSYFNDDEKHTIFTGELLKILKNGLPNNEKENVSLTDLYKELRISVKNKKPSMSPQQLSSKEITGDNLLFFKNTKFDKNARERKVIEEQIIKADTLFTELDFTNAELIYRIVDEKIHNDKINIDKKYIEKVKDKIKDCREIIKYEKVFDNRYKNKYKAGNEELDKKVNQLKEENSKMLAEISEFKKNIEAKNQEINELRKKGDINGEENYYLNIKANFGIRFIADFFDLCVMFLYFILTSGFFGGVLKSLSSDSEITFFAIFYVISFCAYFVITEASSWQSTIGGLVFKLKTADANKNRIRITHSIKYNLAKLLAVVTIVGYFLPIFGIERLDSIMTKTFVFKKVKLSI